MEHSFNASPSSGPEPSSQTTPTAFEKNLLEAVAAESRPLGPRGALREGQQFGGYRIVRRLGSGGMGVVYEAEQLASGRLVALKLLQTSLPSERDREQFLQEGRSAAAINQPNLVYVYGTEEIGGTPVIAKELIRGRTLHQRVREGKPMPVKETVEIVLQMIAGLEAAGAVGILHRDIKPSNCFIEPDGTVKVGDFGLAISTRGAEAGGATAGKTPYSPGFASPEQIRSEPVDVRSDIFSVGATLYFLLTGSAPYKERHDRAKLCKEILATAEPPRSLRSEIPEGLEKIVLWFLDPESERRPRDYEESRRALLPFTSLSLTPAPVGLRLLASAVDSLVLLPGSALLWDLLIHAKSTTFLVAVPFSYYTILEGHWGASVGKRLFGLRVANLEGSAPGFLRAGARWFVLMLLNSVLVVIAMVAVGPLFSLLVLPIVLWLAIAAIGRQRNGYAWTHDLLTGTRVVTADRPDQSEDRWVRRECPGPPSSGTAVPASHIGPYRVLKSLGPVGGQELLLGSDDLLRRQVWIRVLADGQPPVSAGRRDLARPERLRWLMGRRATGESWDAYEAPSGQSLPSLLTKRLPWKNVRRWLFDLAQELETASKDGSFHSGLGFDKVWITADGRAKLLEFAITDKDHPEPRPLLSALDGGTFLGGRKFLEEVATVALEGRAGDDPSARFDPSAMPLPLHARTFLEHLPAFADWASLVAELRPHLDKPTIVSRRARLALCLSCLPFLPLAWAAAAWRPVLSQATPHFPGPLTSLGLSVMVAFPFVLLISMVCPSILWPSFGIVLVGPEGTPAPVFIVLLRRLITWTALLFFSLAPLRAWEAAPLLGLTIGLSFVALVGYSVLARPTRGLHDRILGTYLVPR